MFESTGRVGLLAAALCGAAWMSTGALAEEYQTIAIGDQWAYFRGTEEPPEDWADVNFDDFDWELGPTAIGYGEGWIVTNLADMADTYWSVYTRAFFDVDDPASVTRLRLHMRYDDGFVCYINGIEVQRVGLAGASGTPVPFDTPATNRGTEDQFQDFVITHCEAIASLQARGNVIAIQGHNTGLGSSDFVIEPELFVDDSLACPTTYTCEDRGNGTVRLRWTRPVGTVYNFIELYRNGVLLEKQPRTTSSIYTDTEPLNGENTYKLIVGSCDQKCGEDDSLVCTVNMSVAAAGFRRGDADANGSVNLTDAIGILNHLFRGFEAPACPDTADSNDDGSINLTDAIFLLGSLFQGKEPPPAPGIDDCGEDPSDDLLVDCTYESC